MVAMARVALHHPACEGDPARMLSCLDDLLGRVLARRTMMTCCLVVLEPTRQRLTLINAGHPWPLIVREGSIDFVERSGLPLGRSRKWQAVQTELSLSDIKAVLLYSDGLVEAPGPSGEPIGYSRLRETLGRCLQESVAASIASLDAWFRQQAPGDPPADDVTVLVAQRISGEPGGRA